MIPNKPKAHKYRETKGVELIIWGKTDYGNLNNEKVLLFEVHHTVYISKSLADRLNYFLADLTLMLAKKDWQIKEINELDEYKIVASNFLETILFIIGLYFSQDGQLNNSIKIFEYLLPILVNKEKDNKILEFQIQSGRVRTLLIEMYFLYGRVLHDSDKIKESLEYLNKIPEQFELSQNYPNPFNPATKINYSLPKTSQVTIKVYNILGQEVKTIVNEYQNAGKYIINIDLGSFASGVYIYQMRAGEFIAARKFIMVK